MHPLNAFSQPTAKSNTRMISENICLKETTNVLPSGKCSHLPSRNKFFSAASHISLAFSVVSSPLFWTAPVRCFANFSQFVSYANARHTPAQRRLWDVLLFLSGTGLDTRSHEGQTSMYKDRGLREFLL